MKKKLILTKVIASFFLIVLITGCSSTTLIQSIPEGAKLYLDGEPVGTTPYSLRDTKITGSSTIVKLTMEGYEPLISTLTKDEEINTGAVVGGVFFLIPFLWTMQYKPVHNYELNKITENNAIIVDKNASITDKLKELKKLLEEGLLTQEEFEKIKKKLLE
jgi:hypothetical protein